MRILAISTYDLGTQPLILARIKSELRDPLYEVRTIDLSLSELTNDDISWPEVVIFSIPMHTAMALTKELVTKIRSLRDDIKLCFFGLYAPAALSANLLSTNDIAIAGTGFDTLISWLKTLTANSNKQYEHGKVYVDIGTVQPKNHLLPDRSSLPSLESYVHYLADGVTKTVATLEVVSGCSHHCRHCPVPVIYKGKTRKAPEEEILADARQQIENGASHIHFSDPDFFNRPQYGMSIMSRLKSDFPHLSFDATIKISHILKYRHLLKDLSEKDCNLLIAALEQVNNDTLKILDKGHTKEEAELAFRLLRELGIEPRPSLLPFTPWTTPYDIVELLDFIYENDLVWNVDPVQWSIRLLLPPGSLLLDSTERTLLSSLGELSEDGLSYEWKSPEPVLDELAREIGVLAEDAVDDSPQDAYFRIRKLVFDTLKITYYEPKIKESSMSKIPGNLRPKLSENWFCCAMPTNNQKSRMLCH